MPVLKRAPLARLRAAGFAAPDMSVITEERKEPACHS